MGKWKCGGGIHQETVPVSGTHLDGVVDQARTTWILLMTSNHRMFVRLEMTLTQNFKIRPDRVVHTQRIFLDEFRCIRMDHTVFHDHTVLVNKTTFTTVSCEFEEKKMRKLSDPHDPRSRTFLPQVSLRLCYTFLRCVGNRRQICSVHLNGGEDLFS